ncbi:class I SAM-dependent methyltransferase [Mycobacterium fragae]|uniref:SAM-dependent methyltransferase n=1 Tax=Mycobacterium fragae TaxID=1260918 RepID=A0A1X1UPL1_9MYCO|nr:class I SAM-dependent methyltransferase [Mycobacterium fragae]MCV7399994.1 class I SAM-dependent methyltransferase [Mycobacterium fragae]ORV58681.1 SAM-dependent methyltransferase [Mycobacterium fragae]
MNNSQDQAVNHHADHPGFAGLTGLAAGLVMLLTGRARARLPVEVASVSGADRVVDIGCGPGSSVRLAARRGAQVIGVDPAPVMLRLARTFTRGHPAISWSHGAVEDLPVPDAWATVVWSVATVHHWRDVTAGLTEVRRVLGPGGKFLAIERVVRAGATGLASHGWTDGQAQSFADQCRAAGFDAVRIDRRAYGRRHVRWIVQGASNRSAAV